MIDNLPAGTFHVIAKGSASGTVYKMRSAATTISSGDNSKNDLELQPALNIVQGTVKDGDGNFLPVGTELWFWGERFFVEDNGRFQIPPTPDLKTTELLQELLVNRGKPSEFRVPISFYNPGNITALEITAPLDSENIASFPTIVLLCPFGKFA